MSDIGPTVQSFWYPLIFVEYRSGLNWNMFRNGFRNHLLNDGPVSRFWEILISYKP